MSADAMDFAQKLQQIDIALSMVELRKLSTP
jgi:hypothetical protein